MGFPVRFHVQILPNGTWQEFQERALVCDSLGFDVIGTADHFVHRSTPETTFLECWTAITALASLTSHARLTTYVTQIAFQDPVSLARQINLVDQISGGRVEIGLGAGNSADPSYRKMGMSTWPTAERVARFEVYTRLLDRLLRGEVVTDDNSFYPLDGAQIYPRAVQQPRPPLMIGSFGPRTMRIAANYADIWNTISWLPTVDQQLDELREKNRMLDSICVEVGREPATLQRSATMFDAQLFQPHGHFAPYDSIADFRVFLEGLIEIGITDIGLYDPPDVSQRKQFEQIATEVLPEFRGRNGR